MALSLRGAVEAHYVRLLKQRHQGGGPHPHSLPVLEMDPQGRGCDLDANPPTRVAKGKLVLGRPMPPPAPPADAPLVEAQKS